MNILIKSVRFLLHLARTPPLADVLDPQPGTKKDNLYWLTDTDPEKVWFPILHVSTRLTSGFFLYQITDDDIKEYITNSGESTFHPVRCFVSQLHIRTTLTLISDVLGEDGK